MEPAEDQWLAWLAWLGGRVELVGVSDDDGDGDDGGTMGTMMMDVNRNEHCTGCFRTSQHTATRSRIDLQ
jgi:hypothetical protein